MANITVRLNDNEIERLKKIYGKHTTGVQRAADCWFILRQSTLRDLKGRFTENELKLLIDNENGSLFTAESAYNPEFFMINVADGCEFDGLDKKWNVELKQLLDKIQKLTSAECLFLQDWIEQFWNMSAGESYNKPAGTLEDYVKDLL